MQQLATISAREQKILDIVESFKGIQTAQILEQLAFEGISRFTLIRRLNKLVDLGYITKTGSGRGVAYFSVHKKSDHESYFSSPAIMRTLISDRFDKNIFNKLDSIYISSEIKKLEHYTNNYRNSLSKLSPTIIKKEFERLTIELSWKSSEIEGNTYSLIETEVLLLENTEAVGHSHTEAVMLLNHKKALEYIRKHSDDYKILTLENVEYIHELLTHGLEISRGVRRNAVGITGTQYRPLDIPEDIYKALDEMVRLVNKTKHPIEKALIALSCIAYIQPFEDGNKRTSRLVADAILLAHQYCPISYRSIDSVEYKKAMILFYEQHDLHYLKDLFMEQYIYACENYFL